MRFYNEKINLLTKKIKNKYTFCIVSDIHNTSIVTKKLWDKLIKELKLIKPDYIFIPGDLIQNADDLTDDELKENLNYLLNNLQTIAPIYISLGNHDLRDGKKRTAKDTLKYFKSLETNRLFVLNNETIELKDISITGFSPRSETYYDKDRDSWVTDFVKELKESSFSFNKNKYNIFLTHSPRIISKEETINLAKDILNDIDLIICGHMHDGYIPKVIQRIFNIKSDKGFRVNEGGTLKDSNIRFVDKCRGEHKVLNATMVISRGVRKFTDNNILFNLIDKVCAMDITTIKLKGNKEI